MNIALIGASGNIGSRIAAELSRRDHSVTAIVRNPEKVAKQPGVTAVAGDIHDGAALARQLAGHEAVISAVHFLATDLDVLISAVKQSDVKRWLVVGGAGSLEVAPGLKLVDAPNFPAAYKDEASRGGVFLDKLKTETSLDWSFLSPAALILPGERTGSFRLGRDQLLVDAKGESRISMEDYAIALVDELEKPAHIRQRFTVAY
jgi:putative NADH-flavin reductase